MGGWRSSLFIVLGDASGVVLDMPMEKLLGCEDREDGGLLETGVVDGNKNLVRGGED